MNLSANFSLKELTKSDTATRLGLDNTPGEAEIESLRLLCEKVLQPVRDHFGKSVTVNSGYRSPESNAAVMDRRPQTIARAKQPILKSLACPTRSLRNGSWTTAITRN